MLWWAVFFALRWKRDVSQLHAQKQSQCNPISLAETAPDQPSDAHLLAAEVAAVTAPITTKSKDFIILTPNF